MTSGIVDVSKYRQIPAPYLRRGACPKSISKPCLKWKWHSFALLLSFELNPRTLSSVWKLSHRCRSWLLAAASRPLTSKSRGTRGACRRLRWPLTRTPRSCCRSWNSRCRWEDLYQLFPQTLELPPTVAERIPLFDRCFWKYLKTCLSSTKWYRLSMEVTVIFFLFL